MKIEGDDAVVSFEGDAPQVGESQVLLDADGKLVGIDFGGGGFNRVAVMIGTHEQVARAEPARVSITGNVVRVTSGRAFVR